VASNLAEAGIERSIWEMNEPGGWISPWVVEDDSRSFTLDNFSSSYENAIGDIVITIELPVEQPCFIKATGIVPFLDSADIEKTVQVDLNRNYDSVFDFAIFGEEGIYMNSGAETDSYNSDLGPYEDQEKGTNGHVGTNNTADNSIVLESNAEIYGNVAAGAGVPQEQLDDVINSSAPNTLITGEKYSIKEPFDATPEILPESITAGLEYKGDFSTHVQERVVLTESDSGIYSSFNLNENSTVTIEGNATLFIQGEDGEVGEFSMGHNTSIEIADDGDSSLNLVLGKTTFVQQSNSSINNLSQIPSKLLILGTSEFNTETVGEMHWNSNTELYGAIFAPEIDIYYDSNHDLYGSVICNQIVFNANTAVHYDEALGEVDTILGGVPQYAVIYWQIDI